MYRDKKIGGVTFWLPHVCDETYNNTLSKILYFALMFLY
jgi:hypothetical protein